MTAGQPGRRWPAPRCRPAPRRRPGWPSAVACLSSVMVFCLAITLSGCSGSDGSHVNQPTMTAEQAAAQAEQIVRETADALTPRPTLEAYLPGSTTSACLDDNNPQVSNELVVVSRTYWLRGIPESSNASIGEQVLRFWKRKGWVITNTQRVGTSQPQIDGLAKPYAFGVNLAWSSNGALSIQAVSPCIWPHGTPSHS
jgi:hypothetical protein